MKVKNIFVCTFWFISRCAENFQLNWFIYISFVFVLSTALNLSRISLFVTLSNGGNMYAYLNQRIRISVIYKCKTAMRVSKIISKYTLTFCIINLGSKYNTFIIWDLRVIALWLVKKMFIEFDFTSKIKEQLMI